MYSNLRISLSWSFFPRYPNPPSSLYSLAPVSAWHLIAPPPHQPDPVPSHALAYNSQRKFKHCRTQMELSCLCTGNCEIPTFCYTVLPYFFILNHQQG